MKLLNVTQPIITILPAITILPVAISIIAGLHFGGVEVIGKFILGFFDPSLDKIIIKSSLNGLQLTLATAIISWSISLFTGIILGFISSNIFWKILDKSSLVALLIRRILAIPRSIHELVWGLMLLQIVGLNSWVAIVAIAIPYSCLVARVISDQLDSLNSAPVSALKQAGAKPINVIATSLFPPIIPIILSYGGYRLECAIRGATLLGVFGLGGIGTELQLTLQSLAFNEMWTSLWILGLLMFILEKAIRLWQKMLLKPGFVKQKLTYTLSIIAILILLSLLFINAHGIGDFNDFKFNSINIPNISQLKSAYIELPWLRLIGNTLALTFLAAGIAIGTPPLMLMLFPSQVFSNLISILWTFLRLIPPPLIALLLVICTNPNIFVAAFALGIHNSAIMGRLLKEQIDCQGSKEVEAIISTGAIAQVTWLYGSLSKISPKYLAFAAYRTDVLIRETSVVGLVGGSGLGWQLIESLSSFDWAALFLVLTAFSIITLIGEDLSDRARSSLLKLKRNNTFKISFTG